MKCIDVLFVIHQPTFEDLLISWHQFYKTNNCIPDMEKDSPDFTPHLHAYLPKGR